MKRSHILMAILIAAFATSCNKGNQATTTDATAPTAAAETTAANTNTGTSTGVTECDSYLNKYETCLTKNVPEAARETLKVALNQQRDQWRQAATTGAAQDALKASCLAAMDAAKQAMTSYGCNW